MNIAPHTHKLVIDKKYARPHILVITYGDQTRHLNTRRWGWRKRLDRKVRHIIEDHDHHSRMAYKSPEAVKDVVQKAANEILLTAPQYAKGGYVTSYPKEQTAWGSDLLKEVPKQPVAAE